jgi:hypothetical protein
MADYWKPYGNDDGLIKVNGRWKRVDCIPCAIREGLCKDRFQGTLSCRMYLTYCKPEMIKLHDKTAKH